MFNAVFAKKIFRQNYIFAGKFSNLQELNSLNDTDFENFKNWVSK